MYKAKREEEERMKEAYVNEMNEARKREIEKQLSDYIRQRTEYLLELSLQVEKLNDEKTKLKESLNRMLNESSLSLASRVSDLIDSSGNKFLSDLPMQKKQQFIADIMSKTDKVERSFTQNETKLQAKLSQLKSERDALQSNDHGEFSFSNKGAIMGSSYKLHQAHNALNPEIIAKDREIEEVKEALKNLPINKQKRIDEIIENSSVVIGKQLSPEQVQTVREFVTGSGEYKNYHAQSDITYNKIVEINKEVRNISNEVNKEVARDFQYLSNEKQHGFISAELKTSLEHDMSKGNEAVQNSLDNFDFDDDLDLIDELSLEDKKNASVRSSI